MNEAMMEAMSLEGGDQAFQDSPEAPITVSDPSGQAAEMDPSALAAEGMSYAGQYMASNGPVQAMHSIEDRERGLDCNKMTKVQLKEQKMNEEAGYPSNLDEAQKVKELEGKVSNIETGIGQILSHLSGQSSPVSPASSVPTGGNPASLDVVRTLTPGQLRDASLPSPPSTVSRGSSEPESKQPLLQQVTLKDGRKISVPRTSPPAMNLGPVGNQIQPPIQDQEDPPPDDWDDPIAVVPEAPEEPKSNRDLIRLQQLVQDVNGFMQANNVHKFWRKHLAIKVHRHVGYSGWPKKLQDEFDTRFKGFLSDPQFVSSVCHKVINMEMGHALGAKWVASMLVTTAGFTAFALCGLDG